MCTCQRITIEIDGTYLGSLDNVAEQQNTILYSVLVALVSTAIYGNLFYLTYVLTNDKSETFLNEII